MKYDELLLENYRLKCLLKQKGYIVQIGEGRNNKRKIYLYSQHNQHALTLKNNNPRHAVLTEEYFYKGNGYFLSDDIALKNQNEAITKLMKRLEEV